VVLVYGGSDSLVDIKVMLRELPPSTVATEIPHYEHLDFLWARDVNTQVFQHVFDALDSFTDAEHTKEEFDHYRMVRHESIVGSAYPYMHSHRGSESEASTIAAGSDSRNGNEVHQHVAREQLRSMGSPTDDESVWPSSPEPAASDDTRTGGEAQPTDPAPVPGKDAPSYAAAAKLKGVGVRRGGAQKLDNIVEVRGADKD
jgi:lysosomal acid lipase/cholesteryl ester hydrolase